MANMIFFYIYLNKSHIGMADEIKMEREFFFCVHTHVK